MFDLNSSCFVISFPFCNGDFEYCFSDDFDISLSFDDLLKLDRSLRGVVYEFFTKKLQEK